MDGIGERLDGLGYVRAEGGQRGRVYLARDHAVKLFPADDVAYLSYVRYALDNPSPHLPRVLHGPVEIPEGGWAVVLERLDEPDPEASDFILDEAEGFLLDVKNGDRDDALAVRGRWGEGLPPGLRTALLGIGLTLMRGHGFCPDPSDGNLMTRGGVPVLSDVVCGRSGRPYRGVAPPAHDDGFADLLEAPPAAPAP